MISRLVLFGASGDLAGRYLLPALVALAEAERLPRDFELVGAARQPWDDAQFRGAAAAQLDEHAPGAASEARERVLNSLRYRPVDLADAASVTALVGRGEHDSAPLVAYLALPPSLFAPALRALAAAGLPPGSRIAVEKPFGEDLADAVELNGLLDEATAEAGEDAVFRVDHVLGMATTQNLLALRRHNPALEALWSGEHVERVEVLWDETLALEGRAGYFDGAGTLRDVIQNHAMQLLCLVAMEPPRGGDERELRDRKVEALRSVRSPDAAASRRARYGSGEVDGRPVPAYVDEDGVDPERGTETFAELELELDAPRWRGTRFLLRGGKALAQRRKGVLLRFRAGQPEADAPGTPAALWIGIDGPNEMTLTLAGGEPGQPSPFELSAPPPAGLPAYARVLADLLEGRSELSVRGDEAEEAWRVVTPVLEAWEAGTVPLEEYPAGSEGPPSRARNVPQ